MRTIACWALFAATVALAAAAPAAPTPDIRVCDGPLATSYDEALTLSPRSLIPLCHLDGDPQLTEPSRYRYLVVPAWGELDEEWLQSPGYIRTREQFLANIDHLVRWDDPAWSPWLDYVPGASTIDTGVLEVYDGSLREMSYVLALQALDADGGVSTARNYAFTVHNFEVSTTLPPFLSVTDPDLDVRVVTDLYTELYYHAVSGQPVEFSWTGEPWPYTTIAAYRWGWNVTDYENPLDPGWAVEPGLDPVHTTTAEVVLPDGAHELVVDCTDSAGLKTRLRYHVLVGEAVNFRILENETDPFNPGDTAVYPYYELFRPDGTTEIHTFARGDTVPERARVVFKAAGWNQPFLAAAGRAEGDLMFQGRYECLGLYQGSAPFSFATLYSHPHNTEAWTHAEGGADTLSFLVGPFDYQLTLRGHRDGFPVQDAFDIFDFHGGRAPEVHCVEVVDLGAAAGFHVEPCTSVPDTFYCSLEGLPVPGHPDWTALTRLNMSAATIWFDVDTQRVWHERPPYSTAYDSVDGFFFGYNLLLHARDHDEDQLFLPAAEVGDPTYGDPADRAFSWRYEIISDRDPDNGIADGGGWDDLSRVSYTFADHYHDNYDPNGVWGLRVEVFVPQFALWVSMEIYRSYLQAMHADWDSATVDRAVALTTGQLGDTQAVIRVRDATNLRSDRCAYNYYAYVRVPPYHSESCGDIPLDDFCSESAPVTRQFVIKMTDSTGAIYPPLE